MVLREQITQNANLALGRSSQGLAEKIGVAPPITNVDAALLLEFSRIMSRWAMLLLGRSGRILGVRGLDRV